MVRLINNETVLHSKPWKFRPSESFNIKENVLEIVVVVGDLESLFSTLKLFDVVKSSSAVLPVAQHYSSFLLRVVANLPWCCMFAA